MKKHFKNLVMFAVALVTMLSFSIAAFAAGTPNYTTVKSVTLLGTDTDNAGKKVTNVTLYSNGDKDEVDKVWPGAGNAEGIAEKIAATPRTVTYKVDLAGKDTKNNEIIYPTDINVTVANKNREVATATLSGTGENQTLTVTALKPGTTTITVTNTASDAKKTKKSVTLKVTVKALVDDITYRTPDTVTDQMTGQTVEGVYLEKDGKINLQAASNTNASAKKLSYEVRDSYVLKDDVWVRSVNKKNAAAPVLKVSNGMVTANTSNLKNVDYAKATVRIYATDQKAQVAITNKNGTISYKKINTGCYRDVTVYVVKDSYEKTDIIELLNSELIKPKKFGKTNAYTTTDKTKTLIMYTNSANKDHTYQLQAVANSGEPDAKKKYTYPETTRNSSLKITYTTSNAKVATVSSDGVITAVGNGSATISAVPAYGLDAKNWQKATLKVTVKTKPESIIISNKQIEDGTLTILAGKTAKIGASLPKTVSNTKLNYRVVNKEDEYDNKTKQGIITVKNGTITAKNPGTAQVKVESVEDPGVYRIINVNVIVPVNKVTIEEVNVPDNEAFTAKNKVTLYNYDKEALNLGEDAAYAPQSAYIKVTAEADNKKYPDQTPTTSAVRTSFNKQVAEVVPYDRWTDDEKALVPEGERNISNVSYYRIDKAAAGSGTLTVCSTDGTNKKATLNVTVKRLVDKITVANSYEDLCKIYEESMEVPHINLAIKDNKATKITISASANADASSKALQAPKLIGVYDGSDYYWDEEKADFVELQKSYKASGWSVTVPADATPGTELFFKIEAKDGIKYKIDNSTQNTTPFSTYVVVKVLAEGQVQYATAETTSVKINGSGEQKEALDAIWYPKDPQNEYGDMVLVMKKGTGVTATVDFNNNNIVDRTVKSWAVNKEGKSYVSVNKNGVIKANKVMTSDGTPATITATLNSAPGTSVEKQIDVYVIRTDADWLKITNNAINTELKAENRNGFTAKFDTKKKTITVDITNPALSIADQSNTGIKAMLKRLYDTTDADEIVLEDVTKGVTYDIRLKGATVYVYGNNNLIASYTGLACLDEALNRLVTELENIGYETLEDLNGFTGVLEVRKEAEVTKESSGEEYFGNVATYTVTCNMKEADVDSMIDARIAEQLSVPKLKDKLFSVGIADVTYNAATNTAVVNIANGTKTFAAVDQDAREEVAAALKTIFAGASKASVNAGINLGEGLEKTYDHTYIATDEDLDTGIGRLFDGLVNKYGEMKIFMLENGKADARVTYQYGMNEYTYDYTVKFVYEEKLAGSAVDAQVDAKIAEQLDGAKLKDELKDAGIESVTYDASKNTAYVNIMDGTKTIEEVYGADSELRTELENTVAGVFASFAKSYQAKVTAELEDLYHVEKEYSCDASDEQIKGKVNDFLTTLVEHHGSVAISQFEGGGMDAEVTYFFGDTTEAGRAYSYTFNYYVKFVRTKAAVDAQIDGRLEEEVKNINDAETAKDEAEKTGLSAEYAAESNTLTVKAAKSDIPVTALAQTGLDEALKRVIDGAGDVMVTITTVDKSRENEEGYIVSGTTEKADPEEMTSIQIATALGYGNSAVKTLDNLRNFESYIKVTYHTITEGDVILTYTLKYDVKDDAGEISGQYLSGEDVDETDVDLTDEEVTDVDDADADADDTTDDADADDTTDDANADDTTDDANADDTTDDANADDSTDDADADDSTDDANADDSTDDANADDNADDANADDNTSDVNVADDANTNANADDPVDTDTVDVSAE